MKKQIYDEKNGLSYTLHGGYYLPDLEINEEEEKKLRCWWSRWLNGGALRKN